MKRCNDAFWDELLKVRGEVNKVIEQARADKKVGGSLEAAVTLVCRTGTVGETRPRWAMNYDLSR